MMRGVMLQACDWNGESDNRVRILMLENGCIISEAETENKNVIKRDICMFITPGGYKRLVKGNFDDLVKLFEVSSD